MAVPGISSLRSRRRTGTNRRGAHMAMRRRGVIPDNEIHEAGLGKNAMGSAKSPHATRAIRSLKATN
jgi:hypothetical protein